MSKLTDISAILEEERLKVQLACLAASDKKAMDPVLLDVTDRESFTDYILVCHGTSDRHVQSIHEEIVHQLRRRKIRPIGVEGEQLGHWILMDYGGLIVHIFLEELRDFYDIEGMWADSPQFDIEALAASAPKDDASPARAGR